LSNPIGGKGKKKNKKDVNLFRIRRKALGRESPRREAGFDEKEKAGGMSVVSRPSCRRKEKGRKSEKKKKKGKGDWIRTSRPPALQKEEDHLPSRKKRRAVSRASVTRIPDSC